MADHSPVSLYCDPASKTAAAIFKEFGFPFAESPDGADLLWMRKGYREIQYHLGPHQLLNHIPNETAITDKGHLTENLKRHDDGQPRREFGLRGFYQQTYCLYDPDERKQFFDQLPSDDAEDNVWIIKPADLSQGDGIRILNHFGELRRQYEKPETPDSGADTDRFIMQKYIRNPLLLEGRKSEMRIYWLIASLNPLLVFIYPEGTVRLNSRPFHLGDFDNTLIHVTNVHQQMLHPEYDPSLALKWSFSDLENYLARNRKISGAGFIRDELKPRLKQILAFVVEAARGPLVELPASGIHFGLFGADIILDDALRPWLTEIQRGPGLSIDDEIKKTLIPRMLGETASIMIEIRERKRAGLPLTNLEAPKEFERIIDESELNQSKSKWE